MLKENGYQESIISKIFKRITNNHSLSQSQQQMQATYIQEDEIRMSINLSHVQGTNDKLWPAYAQISHNKIHLLYCSTLHKILCKKRDQIATDDKNKIVYEIDPKNCEAVSFGESKRNLKLHSD